MLQEQLVCAGARAQAANDPVWAAGWLVSTVKTEDVLNRTLPNIVATWADQIPGEAAKWVVRFPDGEARASALEIVSRYWLQLDPAAAAVWIKDLPEGDMILAKYGTD